MEPQINLGNYKELFSYVPHKVQLKFHQSPAKIRAFSGGNRPLAYGTKVFLADGNLKNIEEIDIGDRVLGWINGTNFPVEVVGIPFDGVDDCFEIELKNGTKVYASIDHEFPVFGTRRQWDSGKWICSNLSEIMHFRWRNKRFLSGGVSKKRFQECHLIIKNIRYIGKKRLRCLQLDPLKTRFFIIEGNIVTSNSGKTLAGVRECIWWALGIHPFGDKVGVRKPPVKIRVCGPTHSNVVDDVILPYFMKFLPEELYTYWKEKRILEFFNQSTIHFLSYDQHLERFGGASVHLVWEDEEPP